MRYEIRNDKGQLISGHKQLLKKEYGTGEYDVYGEPKINWKYLSEFADEDGFDTRCLGQNNKHRTEVELPYGTIIIRYGNEVGSFSAPKGTKYEELSLPYDKDTVEYNEYKVIADSIKVSCIVEKGIVAPGFESKGGAVQYLHSKNIKTSIKSKLLERIDNNGNRK